MVLIILYNFSYLYDTLSLGIPFTGVTWASYQTINVLGQFSTAGGGPDPGAERLYRRDYSRRLSRASTTGSMKPPPRWGYPPGGARCAFILPQALRTILPSGFNEIISLAQGNGDGVRPGDAGTVLHHPDDLQPYPGGDPAVDGRRRWYLAITSVLSAIQYLVERGLARSERRSAVNSARSSRTTQSARQAQPQEAVHAQLS
ncbi:amino acid ABC transporter permease [Klebsiella pneumoniae]|uniref:Amino acid ABC transporter permease n=1 Tax=Klebsiella pneumoniae TaxID=573 RepID=A0A377ZYJ7_KLEPN|nr:amino acid ABC transporter permease [Klebsiella pneumoniae]